MSCNRGAFDPQSNLKYALIQALSASLEFVGNLRTRRYAICELGGTQFANLHKHNIKYLKIKNIIRARRVFSFSGTGMALRCGCGRGWCGVARIGVLDVDWSGWVDFLLDGWGVMP